MTHKKYSVIITLPYYFTVRDFFFTPVWDEMLKREDVNFVFMSNSRELTDLIAQRDIANVSVLSSASRYQELYKSRVKSNIVARGWKKSYRWLDNAYVQSSLLYRFAAIHNLSHNNIRALRNIKEQERYSVLSDYRLGEKAGWPLSKSRIIFRLLYEYQQSALNIARKEDLEYLRLLQPDLFVFGRLHHQSTANWAQLLRRLGIPMVGVISSWDHPTTKGPTPRGMSGYVVASKRMRDEMVYLHGLSADKVHQIGKVQMDTIIDPSKLINRDELFYSLGIPKEHRLITFGTNTTGLKEHEVSIAQRLSCAFANGQYGKVSLLLRTHPQDANWRRDFLSLAEPPWVLCMNACSFGYQGSDGLALGYQDMKILASLMKHSDVVIQSRGSLALDAIAFDTPVISLAYDGDLSRLSNDSFLLEYGFEHYKPLVAARGTWLVGSNDALNSAINGYLDDPSIHSQGRSLIRSEHLEPLDGKASYRLIDFIVESIKLAKRDALPAGDWDYNGLGDVRWASRQHVDLNKYVYR